jgi:hypothetical protein
MQNFDQHAYQSTRWIGFSEDDAKSVAEAGVPQLGGQSRIANALRTTRSTYNFTARLTNSLPRNVKRQG